MTTLTVWRFDSEGGARGALQVLERLQKEELLQIVDAAIVTWPPDRKKPKTEQLRSLGGAGALGGAFWAYCSDCSSSSHCSEWRSARRRARLPAR